MARNSLQRRIITYLKNHKVPMQELCKKFNMSKRDMSKKLRQMKQRGITVSIEQSHNDPRSLLYHLNTSPDVGNTFHISDEENKNTQIMFGACSDIHFASKYHLTESFHETMKKVEDEGVKRVYVAGDIVDGVGIYRGHLENLTCTSVEDQTDIASEAFAQHPNLTFWAVSGNHDYSYTAKTGTKPLALIEAKTDNFKNLGDIRADVIFKGVRFRILHGGSGRAYARSYPSQTYLRNYFSGLLHEELQATPQVFLLGHFHTVYYGIDHGMHVIQSGSFQDSDNEFCARKGLTGETGMFVVKMMAKNGVIGDFAIKYIRPEIARREKGVRHMLNTRNYKRRRRR